MELTLRIPRTKIPALDTGTVYGALKFRLPDDRPYQVIAVKPAIDNHHAVHGIVVTTCTDSGNHSNGLDNHHAVHGIVVTACTDSGNHNSALDNRGITLQKGSDLGNHENVLDNRSIGLKKCSNSSYHGNALDNHGIIIIIKCHHHPTH